MHGVKHILKMIGAAICCALCLAVIALFVYVLIKTPQATEPELYHISNSAFLNTFYRYLADGVDFNPLILMVGLVALLFEILFSQPLRFLCQQLPFGRMYESDRKLSVIERILPAVLIGITAGINANYMLRSPDSFAKNAEWINWAALIVIAIIFLAQFVLLFSNGGIWRVLVSGSLLIAGNLGCGALLGLIAIMLATIAAAIAIIYNMLLMGVVIFIILAMASG